MDRMGRGRFGAAQAMCCRGIDVGFGLKKGCRDGGGSDLLFGTRADGLCEHQTVPFSSDAILVAA